MAEQQEMGGLSENESGAAPGILPPNVSSRLFQTDITVRALLEALAEAVVVIDRTGAIIHVNQRTVELFGYAREELLGFPLLKLLPDRFHALHANYVSHYFDQPRLRSMGYGLNLVGRLKNGAEIPLDISLSYMTVKAGQVALAFITDATRRKQAERDLQLRNEQLDAFAHTVAHDLNSSLAVVVGFSEQLAETHGTLSSEELHRYLLKVARSGRKMSNIINELLLFASLRKEEMTMEPLNMAAIVNEAVQRLREALTEQQAQLLLPDNYPAALGHAPWIEEVWFNYLSNALKYGGRPPRIEIGGARLDTGQFKYWVKDNGQGLTPQQQAQLFIPFTQLAHPQIKGHGLGLSIVRQIVERLGGQVGVESEVGRGSTFYFTLPSVAQS